MNKYKNRKTGVVLLVMAFLFLISVTLGLFIYRNSLKTDLRYTSCDTLGNVMEQQKFSFSSKLQDQKSTIRIYADYFENASKMTEEQILQKLNFITKNSTFDHLSYAMLKGDALENTGEKLNIADRAYFEQALTGETVIAGPMVSKTSDTDIITFATPVYSKVSIVAVLIGIYNTENLSHLLMPSFNGQGYTYVTTGEGKVIFKTQTNSTLALYSNLFEALSMAEFHEFDDSKTITYKARTNASGHSQYTYDGERRMMHYAPLGVNDWYIFSIAPSKVINPKSASIMYNTTWFILITLLLSVAMFGYLMITQRSHVKQLSKIAFIDTLTGAPNKRKFKLMASELLNANQYQYAFIILDIDKFKVLNDTLGYACGDELLIHIVQVINQHLKEKEIFARCDSDEYFLLLIHTTDQALRERIQSMIKQVEEAFKVQVNNSYSLVLCVGVYVILNPKESINSISDRARHAHKLIKGRDESGISFYNEEIRNRILEEKEIENKMHSALVHNEFLLYLQPKYYLENEKIYGAEALVRWKSKGDIMIYPNDFIPVFERNGFITKLDMYMLEKACEQIRGWMETGISPIPISINFSRLHLKNPNFVNDIASIVESYAIPHQLIEVEITESIMLDNEEVLIDMLSQLHKHGFTLSMDDFGSGYSSLGLLKNLPVDVIKLDRTFFSDYSELRRAVTVVSGIINMAKNLGIKTVAEGVETKEQIDFLSELGCDIVQGYYYAKPMPALEIRQFLDLR